MLTVKQKLQIEKAKLSKLKSIRRQKNKQVTSGLYLRNQALQTVRPSNRSGSYVNHFRGSPSNGIGGESDAHLDLKYEVWKQLRKMKHDVITEAIFINGGRADILDITDMKVYEILHSESVQKLEQKKDYYPNCFEIIKIHTKNGLRDGDLF